MSDDGHGSEDELDDDSLPSVVLSVCYCSNQRLGLAYYDPRSCDLFATEIQSGSQDIDLLLQSVKQQVNAGSIITNVSTVNDPVLLELMKKPSMPGGAPFKVELSKKLHFEYEHAKAQLFESIKLRGLSDELSGQEKYYSMLSMININDETSMVRALGGLIHHLCTHTQTDGTHYTLQSKEAAAQILDVNTLRSFRLDEYMFIDNLTYRALQIFETEVCGMQNAAELLWLVSNATSCMTGAPIVRQGTGPVQGGLLTSFPSGPDAQPAGQAAAETVDAEAVHRPERAGMQA
jgi:DNA mismatch repair ATPase MutS